MNIIEKVDKYLNENTFKKLSKIAGKELKSGRMTIVGYPVDVDGDASDMNSVEMDAVDSAAARGLKKELEKKGFKVTISGKTGLLIENHLNEDKKEKEKIIKNLIKGGHEKKNVEAMVNKYYDYVVRVYDTHGKTPVSGKADIISTLWSKE